MNYYVISPNVYKDGIERYLSEMKDRHIAIMGWSKGDSKQGNMFARMLKNDRVIIAHGANRNKRVYYAGIVATEAQSYTSDGESQFVELYNFKDISSYKIPFTEENTYGASNQIASIYRLKRDVDANIIDVIERILSVNSFNIRYIEFWAKYQDEYISIPALQRGLVWKPRQVELLWDSMLRGFPIGSFMLSEIADKDGNEKSSEDKRFYLIDGQQRFNAIALGYNAYDENNPNLNPNSIVWFDLSPEPNQNSTRKFWVKLTTKSHPWGYKNDDECSKLTANERRDAMQKFEFNDNIYNIDFNLKQTYPVKARFPIPLYWLLKAPTMNSDEFTDYVLNKFKSNNKSKEYRIPFESLDKQLITQYYECFRSLKDYTINTNLLTAKVLEDETESENSDISDIEVLFNRIGAGGTSISENELLYSAIKAYWPSTVKVKNDELAALYMPAVTLISLAFRLSLTTNEDKSFKGTPSIKRIRLIAKEKGDQYNKIIQFYDNEAADLLHKVDEWLTADDAPNVIRTSIARKCPDIYLLLMYIARKGIITSYEDERFVQAVAFYIYWFGKDNCAKCVNTIYDYIKDSNVNNYRSRVVEALLSLIQKQLLRVFYSPNLFSSVFNTISNDSGWRPEMNNNSSKPWWPCWNVICYNKDLLLYAQREYLKQNFSLYDPAKSEMWDEHNRPWDYDHIIPQDWIHQKGTWRKEYTRYCEAWLNCNGNFAAIPFEKNRGKGNYAEWDEYINNKELLLCDDEIDKFRDLFDESIQTNKDQAHNFVLKTKDRAIRIYQECYRLLYRIFEKGTFEIVDSDFTLFKRKTIIESICSILGKQAQVYYTFGGEEYVVEHEIEWAMPEITVGITNGDRMACMYFHYIDDCKSHNYWVGIGKAPNTPKNQKAIINSFRDYQKCNDDEWWYLRKEFGNEIPIEVIAKEINELVECINHSWNVDIVHF
jgi:hypothetical protein